ncbi:hypothetical protein D3C81_1239100 [compost metagenome]
MSNTLKRLPRGICQQLSIAGQGAAFAHCVYRIIRPVLHQRYHRLNFSRGPLSARRQRSDFVGNHGKSTTLLASACGFNGGIECKQVGLLCNAANNTEQLGNVADTASEFFNHGGRAADFGTDGVNRVHGLTRLISTICGFFAGEFGRLRSRDRVACDFL